MSEADRAVRVVVLVDVDGLVGWRQRVVHALAAVTPEPPRVVALDGEGAAHRRADPAGRGTGWLTARMARALDGPPEPAGPARVLDRRSSPTSAPLAADVVIDLTHDGAAPELGRGAALGCWRLRFGPGGGTDPVRAFTDAALAGRPTVSARLERTCHGDAEVLREGTFRFDAWAPWAGAGAAAASFTAWPAWCVTALREDPAARPPFGAQPAFADDALGMPAPSDVVRAVARGLGGLARRALWAEVWTVGLTDEPVAGLVAGQALQRVRWLPERGATGVQALWAHRAFAADPFLYEGGDGEVVCLFEALDHGEERGWIAAVDVPPAPGALRPRDVFASAWHWSYPFVFTDAGETYCIPETADASGALLHRLTPTGFEQVAVLLPGLPVLDPTVVRHDGRYWLFCALRDGPLLNTELHLFVAEHLRGPYRPHRHNPVKIDARSARPAGTIFELDGALHRPGQDCGRDYGAALVVNRIDELSEHAFREHPVVELRPRPPYPAGLHTLSAGGGWLAIDAKRYAFSPRLLTARLGQVAARVRDRRGG